MPNDRLPSTAPAWDWNAPLTAPLRLEQIRKQEALVASDAELAAWLASQKKAAADAG